MSTPPFQLGQSYYDQSTYLGRCKHFFDFIDPFTLMYGKADADAAKKKLEAYKVSTPEQRKAMNQGELWHAQRVLQTSVHPDTGEVMPLLFRFSAFIPTNIFICGFMLHPATVASPLRSVGIHWFNQSYNCAINFANRNASSEVTTTSILQTYFVACALSVTMALGTTAVMKRIPSGSLMSSVVRATFPFMAVSTAGASNVALMRRAEWIGDGVKVTDIDGNYYGDSLEAGRIGIGKCAITRAAWNVPIMMLPVLAMVPLSRVGLVKKYPLVAEGSLILTGMCVGVPGALALFPQKDSVPASRLEPKFHNLVSPTTGKKVDTLYFNKGL